MKQRALDRVQLQLLLCALVGEVDDDDLGEIVSRYCLPLEEKDGVWWLNDTYDFEPRAPLRWLHEMLDAVRKHLQDQGHALSEGQWEHLVAQARKQA